MNNYRFAKAFISLSNLTHNIIEIQKFIRPSKIMAIVKANAYGHGATNIIPTCFDLGVHHYGVSSVYEGREIRKILSHRDAKQRSSILCFIPPMPSEFSLLPKYKLDVTISDFALLRSVEKYAKEKDTVLNVQLKIDTGMNRLGCKPEDAMTIAKAIHESPYLDFTGIYTHFADSDAKDAFTQHQLEIFLSLTKVIETELGIRLLKHAANSGGVLFHKNSHLDITRIGVSMYGYSPSHSRPSPIALKPVMQLVSKVVFIKSVPKGTSVSYGHSWKSESDTRIATIAIGYADGYPRVSSNKGKILLNQTLFSQVGNVTMDQILIDIGNEVDVKVGDDAIVFGWDNPQLVYELADHSQTIHYERLTSITSRLERINIS